MSPKAVIFDLDGTLYDKHGLAHRLIVWAACRGCLGLLGRERKARKILKGKPFATEEDFYEALFREMGAGTGHSLRRARAWYLERYLPRMVRLVGKHFRPRPWVKPLLESLRGRGIKTAVLSDYGAVREKLTALGLAPEGFDLLADATSSGGLKPCPNAFLFLADSLGVAPGDCLVLGDRDDTDGAGAAAAGMAYLRVAGDAAPAI